MTTDHVVIITVYIRMNNTPLIRISVYNGEQIYYRTKLLVRLCNCKSIYWYVVFQG